MSSAVDERAHQLRALLTTLPTPPPMSDAQVNANSFNIAQYNAQRLQSRKRALREKHANSNENDENRESIDDDNNNGNDAASSHAISAMCVLRAGDRVGAVHYDSARHAFLFAEQQLVHEVNADVRAFLHLLPLRANGALDALGAIVTSSGGGEQFAFIAELQRAFGGGACEHIVIAPSNFNAKSGLRRLELVAQQSTLYVASRIDIENSLLMRCFDGICHLLQKKYQLTLYADSLAANARVVAFDHINLDSLMQLDHNTLVALQIIPHAGAAGAAATTTDAQAPTAGSAPIDSIESLMLLHVSSSIGKALMRRWIRAPLLQLDAIHQRQRMVQFFAAPARLGVVAQLKHLLGTVKSVAPLVRKISAAAKPATLGDIVSVRGAAITLVELLRLCRAAIADSQLLVPGLDQVDSAQLQALVEVIERVVDVSAAKEQGRFVVREGIDKELDDLRFFYDGLGSFFNAVGEEELDALAPKLPCVQSLSIAYYPQLGCQLVVAKVEVHALVRALASGAALADAPLLATASGELLSTPAGGAAPPNSVAVAPPYEVLLNYGLEFQFETSDNVYFKNERMLELDEFLGDIHSDIVDLENAIARQLEATCVQYAPPLLAAIDVAAVLDCALAFASVAQAQRYSCPTVTNEQPGSLYVVNGRHPLLECRAGGGAVVPNNTAIDGVARVQLLTGPNYSGKSIYLKQNALIVYLAQIGSFVPADGAQVTLTDRIFTRLYSNDSASSASPLSSWALDCQQVSTMLQRATPQSLLLIDEFGKGTCVRDGVALLAALLRHLAARPDAPKALVTTHHAELYRRGLLADDVLRSKVLHTQMQFTLAAAPTARDAIVLLYKVVPSDATTAPQSHGLECARRAGLPAAVLARASGLLDDIVADRPIEPVRELSADARTRVEQRARVLARFKAMMAAHADMTDEAITQFVAEIKATNE